MDVKSEVVKVAASTNPKSTVIDRMCRKTNGAMLKTRNKSKGCVSISKRLKNNRCAVTPKAAAAANRASVVGASILIVAL